MSLVETYADAPVAIGKKLYVRAPAPIHFPSEDSLEEHVGETKRHLEARTTLYLLLKQLFAGRAIGSDQFMYWDAGDPRKCLSPDVFVKRSAPEDTFDSWKIWERGAPDIAVEIISASDRRDDDWSEKMARYQASGIGEVVRFDPEGAKQPIRAWDRVDGDLVERAPASPDLRECAALGLWWVVMPSPYGPLLRLARDREGRDPLPTPDEAQMRLAEELAEERKARTLAEHERMLADHARRQAERERDAALAEVEQLRAELARARNPGG